jgi:hypothetical protein
LTYSSIYMSSQDDHLKNRILAAIAKEAWANEEMGRTAAGQKVIYGSPEEILPYIIWPACVDFEVAYEYALGESNTDPGGDAGVITDANIQSAVQTHWPNLSYTIRSNE